MIRSIENDILRAKERERRFLRYFTLAYLYNAGVADSELERQRASTATHGCFGRLLVENGTIKRDLWQE